MSADDVKAAVEAARDADPTDADTHDTREKPMYISRNFLLLPPPGKPMEVSRRLLAERHMHEGGVPTLRHWRGGWWWWRASYWREVEQRALRQVAYDFTEHAMYEAVVKEGVEERAWSPTTRKVSDLLDATAAICHLDESTLQPGWLPGIDPPGGVIVACRNGLLDVTKRELLEHTPLFFNQTAVPFDYDKDAPPPANWLAFLNALWPDDAQSIAALQEWFGYVISGRTDMQKILLWVGPTRGGKGATARVLTALVGRDNVAGPTLDSLGTNFGLAPLLGKSLAVISDARLSGRNTTSVVERLLNVSGEDWVTVDRKYREQWTGKLPARFFVITNELPHFGDASMAIVGRFVILITDKTWLGKEDDGLEARLHEELPGILNWSLEGLDRLIAQRRFTLPKSTAEAIIALQDLASPVAGFVREQCKVEASAKVSCDVLYGAWKSWAEANGNRVGSIQTFGRNLRAVVPMLKVFQPREDGEQKARWYQGVGFKDDAPKWPPVGADDLPF